MVFKFDIEFANKFASFKDIALPSKGTLEYMKQAKFPKRS